jgi:hypothetical protein
MAKENEAARVGYMKGGRSMKHKAYTVGKWKKFLLEDKSTTEINKIMLSDSGVLGLITSTLKSENYTPGEKVKESINLIQAVKELKGGD